MSPSSPATPTVKLTAIDSGTGDDSQSFVQIIPPPITFVNTGRVILDVANPSPILVLPANPFRTGLKLAAYRALVAGDPTTVISSPYVLIRGLSSPLELNNYNGEIWAMHVGPAFEGELEALLTPTNRISLWYCEEYSQQPGF